MVEIQDDYPQSTLEQDAKVTHLDGNRLVLIAERQVDADFSSQEALDFVQLIRQVIIVDLK